MVLTVAASTASLSAAEPRAKLDAGEVQGAALASGAAMFKGIPFAAPPVGPLRWRGPQPVIPWTDVRTTTAYGPSCPQNPFPGDANPLAGPFSEDCLYLNVWAPPGAKAGDGLPVLFSIHGGGLVNGGAGGPVFEGEALARRGIVVVTINYRLGRLGFFAHPLLQAAGGDGAGVNFGFMDQIAALQWVQRNIAAFGGDPERVTIAGESAGGASVQMLMVSPRSRGLFSAAIAQSSPARSDFVPMAAALKAGSTFARKAGLGKGGVDALRDLPMDRILSGVTFFRQDRRVYSGPAIDGDIIPLATMPAFAAGCQARVPYMVGTTGLELGGIPAFFAKAAFAKTPKDELAAILAVYDQTGERKREEVAWESLSDRELGEPARQTARLAAGAGQPVWIYRFNYIAEHSLARQLGAHHASDVPYTFDTLGLVDSKASPPDLRMAQVVADYWVNFVRFHDPNGASLPAWGQAGAGGDQIMRFEQDGPHFGPDPRAARFDALERLAKPAVKADCPG